MFFEINLKSASLVNSESVMIISLHSIFDVLLVMLKNFKYMHNISKTIGSYETSISILLNIRFKYSYSIL